MTTPNEDLDDLPLVAFPGERFDRWRSGYEWGGELAQRFPDQAAHDFASAVTENSHPFGDDAPNIVNLVCTHLGENDGSSWVWEVDLDNGDHWRAEAWCDYTGWDCRSGIAWEQL